MIEAVRQLRPGIVVASLLLAACGRQSEATLMIDTGGGEVEVAVEVADSAEERSVGLMNRKELDQDAGMVFLVPEPTDGSFWMKDTLIPLSVAFWGQENRIIRILDMEPCRADPCPLYPPGGLWVGAVEVNQGFFEDHGVEVGDTVSLRRSDG